MRLLEHQDRALGQLAPFLGALGLINQSAGPQFLELLLPGRQVRDGKA